jgi:cyclopropane-fatty-acyl-phospholipid synthase
MGHSDQRNRMSHHTEALSFVDEATYRVWRLYLAGSAHGFRRGHLAVYQTLLAQLDTVDRLSCLSRATIGMHKER